MIVVQSMHMLRSLFSAFLEVLLVDATHGTNASRYHRFSFMIHDLFGRGQHVQKCNPSWMEVRCIVADQDFTEIGVLKNEFPEARVLLCQFHAIYTSHSGGLLIGWKI
ncbi:hypothetical protein PHMEG_0003032 [Phytophthora megakarya]|uniref:ZSWIM1/3 RNaseH-like domain-containing protein n=1 Tax=Phytophthora megakarya TaxID=4795 RepID=A0A225WZF7_9STRA|nr:hypothetical protein PHMEG_0003032 [Phytophthora megakarya]